MFSSFLRCPGIPKSSLLPVLLLSFRSRQISMKMLDIHLNEPEKNVCDFLLGAANLHAKSSNAKKPVIRFAGGWVRDKLLGVGSKDIDVAIDCMTGKEFYACMKKYEELQPDAISTLGRLAEIKKDAEKSKHMETANTKLYGLELDLVNLRTETYAEDSRNPQIKSGTAREDAMRRDATINAIFFNLNTQEFEDFTGHGIEDLKSGIIRTPLDPEQTFRDDPLRMLRLIRFACRYDFQIVQPALDWMRDKSIQTALERKISRERILVELQKMLQGPRPRDALTMLLNRDLFDAIFTVPDAPDRLIPKADSTLVMNALRELHSIIPDGAEMSDSAVISLQEHLLFSKEEHYWAWLVCSLFTWIGHSVPTDLQRKGAPTTLAALIAREGLKIDNETMKKITTVDTYIAEASEYCKAFNTQEALTGSSSKRKRSGIDRVASGLAIRRWGKEWRLVISSALIRDVCNTDSNDESVAVRQSYIDWLDFVRIEELGDAWNSKSAKFSPIINGSDIAKAVRGAKGSVTNGPWMSKCVHKVFEYQLRERDEANKEGAIKEVIDAISGEDPEIGT